MHYSFILPNAILSFPGFKGEKLNAKSIEFRAAIDRSLDHSFGVDAMAASPMSVIDDLVRLSDYGELQRRERERKMTH